MARIICTGCRRIIEEPEDGMSATDICRVCGSGWDYLSDDEDDDDYEEDEYEDEDDDSEEEEDWNEEPEPEVKEVIKEVIVEKPVYIYKDKDSEQKKKGNLPDNIFSQVF